MKSWGALIAIIISGLLATPAYSFRCPTGMIYSTDRVTMRPICKCANVYNGGVDIANKVPFWGSCHIPTASAISNPYNPPQWIDFTTSENLVLWLDGSDPNNNGVMPKSGETISTWYDKTKNHNDAVYYSKKSDSKVESASSDSMVASASSDSKVESASSDIKIGSRNNKYAIRNHKDTEYYGKKSDSKIESRNNKYAIRNHKDAEYYGKKSDSKIESASIDKAESISSDSKAESASADSKAESASSDSMAQSAKSDNKSAIKYSRININAKSNGVLNFDGTNTCMWLPGFMPSGDNSYTVFAVVSYNPTLSKSYNKFTILSLGSKNGAYGVPQNSNLFLINRENYAAPTYFMNYHNKHKNAQYLSDTNYALSASKLYLMSTMYSKGSEANWQIAANANSKVIIDTLSDFQGIKSGFYVGCEDGSVGASWNGQMAEILVFNNKLDPITYEQVQKYLVNKWGL